MSKRCAKCEKTVYPIEELKCLDKVWHKGCFKCQECNMTLNMKNYKGYNKLPYCNAHYPTTKHTAVAETPEMRRIAENTKIQSNVQYHSDFEKAKGSYIQVADTPDMIRHQLNTKNSSLIQYHKNFEESKAKYTQIADTPEIQTHLKNTKNISLIEYRREFEGSKFKYTQVPDTPELQSHLKTTKNVSLIEYQKDFEKSKGSSSQVHDTVEMKTHRRNLDNVSLVKYHEDFEKMKGKKLTVTDDPELLRIKQNTAIQSNIEYHKVRDQLTDMEQRRPAHEQVRDGRVRTNPGKVSDYDPEVNQGGTPYSTRNQQARVVYDSNIGKDRNYNARSASTSSDGGMENTSSRKVGSIADYDPLNEQYGSIAGQPQQYREPPRAQSQNWQPPPQSQPPPPQSQPPPPQSQPPPPAQQRVNNFEGKGRVCQAVYDYTAADDDEISFFEGDYILNCQSIDEGWMEGTVQRTGQHGMLPANYVERIN